MNNQYVRILRYAYVQQDADLHGSLSDNDLRYRALQNKCVESILFYLHFHGCGEEQTPHQGVQSGG
jgi:hypothetical protein